MDKTAVLWQIEDFINDKLFSFNRDGVVLEIDGKLDSTVVASILSSAIVGTNTLHGIIFENEKENKSAKIVAEELNMCIEYVKIKPVIKEMYEIGVDETIANVSHPMIERLKMTIINSYAESGNLLVSGSLNLSDYLIGNFTKFGESGVDIQPIIDLTRTEVYEMAKHLACPMNIINKSTNSKDKIKYKIIDKIIRSKSKPNKKLDKLFFDQFNSTGHKRIMPYGCQIRF